MTKKLFELFAVPTGNLQTVTRIAGTPIFTSPDLKRKYIAAMAKSGKTMPIIKKLKDLVDKEIVTPVYSTNKALKSIVGLQPKQIKGFAGVLTQSNDIYIFVETESNLFSFNKHIS